MESREDIQKRFDNVAKSKTFKHIRETYDLKNKSVLDIGCTYGEFLAHFGKNSVGVTIVQEETDYAVKHNLDVITGNIEDNNFSIDKKFDVIFANNLFEHLYSPHNFLVKVKKNLNSGGVLILGVPCIPKISSLMKIKKFRGSLASNHINFFTYETLVKTVERAGWNVQLCRSFHFKNTFIDKIMQFIVPHFYVVATPNPSFEYPWKRKKELVGYKDTGYEN